MTLAVKDRVHTEIAPAVAPTLFYEGHAARYLAGTIWAIRSGRALVRWDDPSMNISARFTDVRYLRKGEPPK